jgi:penicillin-binding protein 2
MLVFDQLNKGDRALRTVAGTALVGLLLLGVQLWRLQVFSAAKYRQSQETQSFRTVRVPALRGKILDRTGHEIVGNTPRYRLDLYLDELRPQFEAEYQRRKQQMLAPRRIAAGETNNGNFFTRLLDKFHHKKRGVRLTREEITALERQVRYTVVTNTVATVAARMGLPMALSEDALQRHYLQKRFLPLAILPNCTPAQIALITEQGWTVPGVALEQVAVRNYPNGSLAVHLVGHLRRFDNYDEEEGSFDYRLPDYVGGIGLEASFDHELRGVAGAKSILVNSAGYRHRQAEEILAAPQTGQNLVTTLDLELQKVTEKALGSVKQGDERGAVVVLNPVNGDILALASAPAFDPTEFIDGVSTERWNGVLMAEPQRPMFNRATYGEYAPGSTFKIIHALALLENGLNPAEALTVGPDPRNPRKGAYILGNRAIGDTADPGEYNFHRAFIRSSNTYFIHHGLRLGWEKLLGMGHRFGLGDRTGLRIGEEARGFLPTIGEVRDRGLNVGQLANVCIGQDQITVTPIQMAVAMGAVANGGKIFWPRVVDRLESGDLLSEEKPVAVKPGQLRNQINLPPRVWEVVRSAMRDDVADDEGTGKATRLKDFAVCGKTGTAEIKGNGRKDKVTWFTSFAPYEAPRYVVVVMVESGGSGGGTCAPVAKQIYQFLRDREQGITKGIAAR